MLSAEVLQYSQKPLTPQEWTKQLQEGYQKIIETQQKKANEPCETCNQTNWDIVNLAVIKCNNCGTETTLS